MSEPIRVQRRRTKGWRMPENTVYVGRGSRWGNPWRVVEVNGTWFIKEPGSPRTVALDSRLEALQLAVTWFAEAIPNHWENVQGLDDIRSELRGKNLACWCPLDQPCHADVLLEIANDTHPYGATAPTNQHTQETK